MFYIESLVSKLVLSYILCYTTIAAPIAEHFEGLDPIFNDTIFEKRALGDQNEPFDITFNIEGWENIAEENCFAMLCLLNGNRV